MNEQEWLDKRQNAITGSGASAVMGLNPYMSRGEYWEILTGRKERKDLSGNPAVEYGKAAESHIIELFKLDNQHLRVAHKDYDLRKHPKYDFLLGSLDAVADSEEGKKFVVEIKTTTVNSGVAIKAWDNKIPVNYFYQCLHYLLVTGYDGAILKALIKLGWKDESIIRQYEFSRKSVQPMIDELLDTELIFWHDHVVKDVRPNEIINF